MSNPNSGQTPEPSRRRSRALLNNRTILIASGVFLVALAGGAWFAWFWIHNRLAPIVAANLEDLLGRQVRVGDLERIGLNSLRFGPSAIPPTQTDLDQVSMKAVEVEFSLLQLLFNRQLQLNVTLVQPDAYIEQDAKGRWISTTIKPQEAKGFITTDLQSLRVQDGRAVLRPAAKPKVAAVPVTLQPLNGTVRFQDRNQLVSFDATAETARSGSFKLTGEARPAAEQANLTVQAQNIAVAEISRLATLPIALQAGRASGNLTLQLRRNQQPTLFGIVTLNNVRAQVENLPQPFNNTKGPLSFRGRMIGFENVSTQYGKIPALVKGTVNLETGYNLAAQVQSVTASTLLETLKIKLPVPIQGVFRADLKVEGGLRQPILSGAASTLRPAQIDRIGFQSISSQFRLTTAPTPARIAFSNIRALPSAGGEITGSGEVIFGSRPILAFNVRADDVPGDTVARLYGAAPGITIGRVSAIAQVSGTADLVRTVVQFRAPGATYPGTGELVIAGRNVLLRNALFNVAGGTVQARGQLIGTQIQGLVTIAQVRLNQFSQDLRGRLNGTLQVAGSSTALRLSNLQAEGQVNFSEGLAVVERPLTAQIRWTGEQLVVQRATAPGLLASGTVAVLTEGVRTPQISGLDLAVQAQGFNLRDFNLNLPNNVALVGVADFSGRVTGTPTAPNAAGALQLRNLSVNGIAFDPVLTGSLDFRSRRRTDLQLVGTQVTGTRDRIALTLGPNNRPTSFLIERDQAIARGRTVGNTLFADVSNFPITTLQPLLPAQTLAFSLLSGTLSGNFSLNLDTFSGFGDIAIAQPRIGRFTGEEVRGRITVANGGITLTNGELRQGDSRIALSGGLLPGRDRQFQFQVALDQANIQNVLQALNISELADLTTGLGRPDRAGASALQPLPSVGLPNASLLAQLRRLSEIEALLAQQRRTDNQRVALPPLAELQGRVSGTVGVIGSLQRGLNFSFDLQGQNWKWGDYNLDTVIAQGNYANGVFNASALRLDINQGTLAFTGRLAPGQLNGQLQAINLPLDLLRPFVTQSPVDFAGRLNATANLSGSVDNPRLDGTLNLVNASLNNQPIQQAQLNFRYDNARLDFNSTVLLTGTQPLEVLGSVPIALPFAAVKPASEQIRLRARVQNEGLALLNLVTNQVTWVDGQGQADVTVTGTLNQPIVEGLVTVQNATLRAQALPRPLTNVTGTARLNGDLVTVETLQATYNGGRIVAQGSLPLLDSPTVRQTVVNNPLAIALTGLELNLQGLYRGGVAGNFIITGSAFSPVIGGTVQLSNGEIVIGETPATTTPTTPTTGQQPRSPISFNNLQLILATNLRITRQPLLSFFATGDLTVNGTVGDLQPEGTIRLTRGQLNLFTTQFTLARGYEHTATFTPETGLDPILDIRLVALVPEVTGSRLPTSPLSSEIVDNPIGNDSVSSIGTLRTIRVQARVTGPASELSNNLELTSSPGRSEAEIIALIGGSFVNTLGRGDPTLGIATLAGSALFGNLQGIITQLGQTVGLSELRIYPTLVENPRSQASVLGLAVEGVVDITSKFSVSVSRVFAADDPFRFNVLYRLNDEILMRASTDLQGDTRAFVQYETRF